MLESPGYLTHGCDWEKVCDLEHVTWFVACDADGKCWSWSWFHERCAIVVHSAMWISEALGIVTKKYTVVV